MPNKMIEWERFKIETTGSIIRLETKYDERHRAFADSCKERHDQLDRRLEKIDEKLNKAIPNWGLGLFIAVFSMLFGFCVSLLSK